MGVLIKKKYMETPNSAVNWDHKNTALSENRTALYAYARSTISGTGFQIRYENS